MREVLRSECYSCVGRGIGHPRGWTRVCCTQNTRAEFYIRDNAVTDKVWHLRFYDWLFNGGVGMYIVRRSCGLAKLNEYILNHLLFDESAINNLFFAKIKLYISTGSIALFFIGRAKSEGWKFQCKVTINISVLKKFERAQGAQFVHRVARSVLFGHRASRSAYIFCMHSNLFSVNWYWSSSQFYNIVNLNDIFSKSLNLFLILNEKKILFT